MTSIRPVSLCHMGAINEKIVSKFAIRCVCLTAAIDCYNDGYIYYGYLLATEGTVGLDTAK